MDITSHDVMIIERALKTAMNVEREQPRIRDYQEVLAKMRESANHSLLIHGQITSEVMDGLRYDYDDSSDLM
ncbi:hypothetical protein ABE504_05960 [Paenibacillus oryzisoli]|uniref:hypothetical protein n=1 Tax=Paenibacillus oryzisoli TaxID=1850517 RepID=UPI003D2A118C